MDKTYWTSYIKAYMDLYIKTIRSSIYLFYFTGTKQRSVRTLVWVKHDPFQLQNYYIPLYKPPHVHHKMCLFLLFLLVSDILKSQFEYRWFPLQLSFWTFILTAVFSVIGLSVFISRAAGSLQALKWWSLLCASLIVLTVFIAVAIIWRQPQNKVKAAFMACLT